MGYPREDRGPLTDVVRSTGPLETMPPAQRKGRVDRAPAVTQLLPALLHGQCVQAVGDFCAGEHSPVPSV